ncbi:TetR family transcriptional regulator [Reticulibacter mediterranei]|uniref:TetR family transcriptional regulator n=1 Tax=Reticulibacter mediterranei TaxID=2778369 RepID=A0A8J3N833_9CHLR|nr:TetR/AcrR family transcriptional regulator [Reticulibacter mediterranei]GHO97832.1 TetR family transcriptional regulator [Reticulibacter mediterranei]
MTHGQTDLRIRRTHKLLQEAMIALIAERGFDAITVGDIADRAMVNRATFYRHYEDKYDLVAKIFEEMVNELINNMKPQQKKFHVQDPENPADIWVQLFTHFAEHADLYRALLGKNGSSWFADRVRDYAVTVILERKLYHDRLFGSDKLENAGMPPELPVVLLAHTLLGAITWWLESEKSYTPKQMASWFLSYGLYGYAHACGIDIPRSDGQCNREEMIGD